MKFKFTITHNGITHSIDEPIGWKKRPIMMARHPDYRGFTGETRTTFPFEFYNGKEGNAYTLIKHIYDNEGLDAVAIFEAQVLCNKTWQLITRNTLSMETYSERCEKYCSINIMLRSVDCASKLFAFDDETINIATNKDREGNALPSYAALPYEGILTPQEIVDFSEFAVEKDCDNRIWNSTTNFCTDFENNTMVGDTEVNTPHISGSQHSQHIAYVPIMFNKTINDHMNAASAFADMSQFKTFSEKSSYDDPSYLQYHADLPQWNKQPNVDCEISIDARIGGKISLLGAAGGTNLESEYKQVCSGGTAGIQYVKITLILEIDGVQTIYPIYTNTHCINGKKIDHYPLPTISTNFHTNINLITLDTIGNKTIYDCNNVCTIHPSYTVQIDFVQTISVPYTAASSFKLFLKIEMENDVYKVFGTPDGWYKTYAQVELYTSSYLKIATKCVSQPTPSKLFMVNECLARLAEATTGGCYTAYSEYFGRTDSQPYNTITSTGVDGDGSLTAFASGLHLRQAPETPEPVPLFSSLKQYFNNLNAIHNIGMGIEPLPSNPSISILRIEPIQYFYNNTIIFRAINANHITRKTKLERSYGSIFIGYDKWQAQQQTGLDEFATKREYSTNLINCKNRLEKLSGFIASGYHIEIMRRNEYNSTNRSDMPTDKDLFVICMQRNIGGSPTVPFIPEQGNVLSPTNIVTAATIYNFRISPYRNLMRWFKSIASVWRNYTTKQMLFNAGEANYIAGGELSGTFAKLENAPKADNATLAQSDFANVADAMPIHTCEEVEVMKYPMSWTQWQTIRNNPKGIIEYSCRNMPIKQGYLESIEYYVGEGEAILTILPKYEI